MVKFCTNCGQSLNSNNVYCPNCGKEVNNSSNSTFSNSSTTNNGNLKSKIAAGILGIFFGAFGVHNFYLGYNGKAVAQLLISILSCGALTFVSYIWGLVEAIMILTGSINVDAKGNPLGQ